MRRALVLLALAGCASAGNVPDETTPRQATLYSSPETGMIMAERPRAATAPIAAPPATVWLAVKKVYADLEIPLVVENPSSRQIGNPNFTRTRQFGGRPMAELVDCGSGMTGPKAATYRMYISLLTQVIPDAKGGTTIQTTFVPMGQDMSGNSSDRIPCGTTGRFEQYFIEQVKMTLGKS